MAADTMSATLQARQGVYCFALLTREILDQDTIRMIINTDPAWKVVCDAYETLGELIDSLYDTVTEEPMRLELTDEQQRDAAFIAEYVRVIDECAHQGFAACFTPDYITAHIDSLVLPNSTAVTQQVLAHIKQEARDAREVFRLVNIECVYIELMLIEPLVGKENAWLWVSNTTAAHECQMSAFNTNGDLVASYDAWCAAYAAQINTPWIFTNVLRDQIVDVARFIEFIHRIMTGTVIDISPDAFIDTSVIELIGEDFSDLTELVIQAARAVRSSPYASAA